MTGNPLDPNGAADELAKRREKKKRSAKDEESNAEKILALEGRYAFIADQDKAFDMRSGRYLTKGGFDSLYRKEIGRSAFNAALEAGVIVTVDGQTWEPGQAQIIEQEGERLLNTYKGPAEKPAEGDVTHYLELATYLIPDEEPREAVFDWAAFVIQHPDEKPNWHPALGGQEGIGKDALFAPVRRAVGYHNTAIVGPHELESQFNDWAANKKILILNETLSFRNARLENLLKQYAAAPPDEIAINPKGGARYPIRNLLALIAMTNYRSKGLTLSKHDRRWMPYWSPAKALPEDYYTGLWQWLEGNGGLAVWHWLANRDLSEFNPKGRAPHTEYKAELVEISEDPYAAKLREAIEAEVYPFVEDLVTRKRVLEFLDNPNNPKLDSGRVGGLLDDLDCKRHRGAKKIEGKVRTLRVWSVRNHKKYSEMRATELYDLAERITTENHGNGGGWNRG